MEQTITEYDSIIKKCKDIFAKKMKDYGSAWRILRISSLTDQIFIKANRIRTIQETGENKVGEAIEDEFVAIINYCTMGLVQLELGYDSGIEMTVEQAILNYDEKSDNLFKWYQQLIAESLGKKSRGILPLISSMPKDNHSLMQLYLDGPKKNFYTFFSVYEKNSNLINKKKLLGSHYFLKNKNLQKILYAQKKATENVFKNKKIPFRSFELLNRSEQTLGEIFCFFILETILLGRALKVNPFDQPSVELIKRETKKILLKN